MAFKLTKQEQQRRADLVTALNDARGQLEDAVNVFNAAVEEAKAPLTAALENYNALVDEARGFTEDIASQADTDISEKSEKWQEGERGEAAIQWKDEWEAADFDAYEIEFPEELSYDQPDHPDTLEGLPEAADA